MNELEPQMKFKIAFTSLAFTSLAILFITDFASAQTATAPKRIRGVIEAVDGTKLTIKTREGNIVTVSTDEKTRLSFVVKASFADIKPGSYLGIAAQPQGEGPQKALEVLIFPDAARGAGEGHRGWDLTPESTMTNATMTETVAGVTGQIITMKYKDGEKKITVNQDIPVVTLAPATKADIKPGVTIFSNALPQADGSLIAGNLTMGKDGVNPPM